MVCPDVHSLYPSGHSRLRGFRTVPWWGGRFALLPPTFRLHMPKWHMWLSYACVFLDDVTLLLLPLLNICGRQGANEPGLYPLTCVPLRCCSGSPQDSRVKHPPLPLCRLSRGGGGALLCLIRSAPVMCSPIGLQKAACGDPSSDNLHSLTSMLLIFLLQRL